MCMPPVPALTPRSSSKAGIPSLIDFIQTEENLCAPALLDTPEAHEHAEMPPTGSDKIQPPTECEDVVESAPKPHNMRGFGAKKKKGRPKQTTHESRKGASEHSAAKNVSVPGETIHENENESRSNHTAVYIASEWEMV